MLPVIEWVNNSNSSGDQGPILWICLSPNSALTITVLRLQVTAKFLWKLCKASGVKVWNNLCGFGMVSIISGLLTHSTARVWRRFSSFIVVVGGGGAAVVVVVGLRMQTILKNVMALLMMMLPVMFMMMAVSCDTYMPLPFWSYYGAESGVCSWSRSRNPRKVWSRWRANKRMTRVCLAKRPPTGYKSWDYPPKVPSEPCHFLGLALLPGAHAFFLKLPNRLDSIAMNTETSLT